MQIKNAKSAVIKRIAMSGMAVAVIGSVGCKSGLTMPGASMLGFKKSPSAETLAGQGPSVTYSPSTPGDKFTPNAITSKAAGTGSATTASVPQNAGVANGFASGTSSGASTPPSYALGSWGTGSSAGGLTSSPYGGAAGTAGTSGAYTQPGSASLPNYSVAGNAGGTTTGFGTPNDFAQSSYTQQPGMNQFGAASTGGAPSGYAQSTPGVTGNQPPYGSTAYGQTPYGQPASFQSNPSNYAASSADAYGYPSQGTTNAVSASASSTNSGFVVPQAPAGSMSDNLSRSAAGGYSGFAPGSTSGTGVNPYAAGSSYVVPGQSDASAARVAGGVNAMQPTTSGSNTQPAAYRPGSTAGASSYPTTPYSAPSSSIYR